MSASAGIQGKLRKQYLSRLADRMRRMRRDLVDRNWSVLKKECRQLKGQGEAFHFFEITTLAEIAERAIPDGETSRAVAIPEAKLAVESLIAKIDFILVTSSLEKM